jgi:hypothetical protein
VKIVILYRFAKICLILRANIYLASGLWKAGVVSFTAAYPSLSQFIHTEGKRRSHMWNDIENCKVDKAPKIPQHPGGGGRRANTNFFQTGFHSSKRRQYSARDLK